MKVKHIKGKWPVCVDKSKWSIITEVYDIVKIYA